MSKKVKIKAKIKRHYKLPNGKLTTSVQQYTKEWKSLAKPIAKVTGSKLIGFDPRFLFYVRHEKGDFSFSMGVYEAQLIGEALKEKSK